MCCRSRSLPDVAQKCPGGGRGGGSPAVAAGDRPPPVAVAVGDRPVAAVVEGRRRPRRWGGAGDSGEALATAWRGGGGRGGGEAPATAWSARARAQVRGTAGRRRRGGRRWCGGDARACAVCVCVSVHDLREKRLSVECFCLPSA